MITYFKYSFLIACLTLIDIIDGMGQTWLPLQGDIPATGNNSVNAMYVDSNILYVGGFFQTGGGSR